MSRPLSTFRLESEVVHRSSTIRRQDEVSLVLHIGNHSYSQTDPARTDMAGTLEGWTSEVLKHGPQMKSKALFDADFEVATQSVLHAEFDPDADVDAARQIIGEHAWNCKLYLLPFGPWFENVFVGAVGHDDLIRLWGGAYDIPQTGPWQPVWIHEFDTNVLASEFFAEFERLTQQLTRHCNS